jgi:D-sedoheptulose 7-phosphate isomerase
MQTDEMLIEKYLSEMAVILQNIPIKPLLDIAAALKKVRMAKRNIYIFGNGGSAATASHMACDFGKNTRMAAQPNMRVMTFNDNMPTLSAFANDEGYDVVFSEPLKSMAEPGDLVIAISGSGNSPNVLNGIKTAHEMGLTTVGLTGMGGGKLQEMVDLCVVVPSNRIEQVEDFHLIIDHLLTIILMQA